MSTKDYFPRPHPKTHRYFKKRYKKKKLKPISSKNVESVQILPNDNTINGIPITNGASCECPITFFNPLGLAKKVK